MSSKPKGPPKHQNRTAWKAHAGVKKNDKELGGKLHPYPEISGVCPRCKAQIEWRRKYGKYKALIEPTKCNHCSKRAVRQAYHALCSVCARERDVCAKCCQPSQTIVGKDAESDREQQQVLEQALKNLRERDRRTLLRAMNKGSSKDELKRPRTSDQEEASRDKREMEDESDLEDEEGSSCPEDESDLLNAVKVDSDQDSKKVKELAVRMSQVQHLDISQ